MGSIQLGQHFGAALGGSGFLGDKYGGNDGVRVSLVAALAVVFHVKVRVVIHGLMVHFAGRPDLFVAVRFRRDQVVNCGDGHQERGRR